MKSTSWPAELLRLCPCAARAPLLKDGGLQLAAGSGTACCFVSLRFADEFLFNPQFDIEPDYIIRKSLVYRIPRYILRREILSTFHTQVDRRSVP